MLKFGKLQAKLKNSLFYRTKNNKGRRMSKKAEVANQSPGGIKEIRDIIFGEYLNTLQKQIDELKKENIDLKEELNVHEQNITESSNLIGGLTEKLGDSNKEIDVLNEYFDSMKVDFEKQLKSLKSSKIGKNQIGQAFIEWGTKVKEDQDS